MNLFLSPHNDDETLFGAFTIMAAPCEVVIVFDSYIQAQRGLPINAEERRYESRMAAAILNYGVPAFLGVRDDRTEDAEAALRRGSARQSYVHVFAPAIEEHGHAHHNLIGKLAGELWPGKVTHYMTYTTAGKSRGSIEVIPAKPEFITRKLRALACYRSQIETPGTGCAEHFMRDLREWYE